MEEAPCGSEMEDVEAEAVFHAAREEYLSKAARRKKRLQRTAILRSMDHSKKLVLQLFDWGIIGAEPGPGFFCRSKADAATQYVMDDGPGEVAEDAEVPVFPDKEAPPPGDLQA